MLGEIYKRAELHEALYDELENKTMALKQRQLTAILRAEHVLNHTKQAVESLNQFHHSVRELEIHIHVVIVMAAVVFIYLTKFGFLVRYVGMVTPKSVKYTIVNDAFQTAATIIIWYIVGWGFAFGEDNFPDTGKGGYIGKSMFLGQLGNDLKPEVANKWANFLQQMGYCLISATIPLGWVYSGLLNSCVPSQLPIVRGDNF
jgi:hypothetical protein